jgi:hypothetical protein
VIGFANNLWFQSESRLLPTGDHELAANTLEPGSPSAKSADIVFPRDEGYVLGYETKLPTDFVVGHFRVRLNVFQQKLVTLRL